MKVVQINASCDRGSTGKIVASLSRLMSQQGIENYILYSAGRTNLDNGISCCGSWYTKFQALKARILGNYGFNSQQETRRMIRLLDKIKPDIVHLHNVHGHDCHLEMLLNYLKQKKIKLYWTFHDCWAFTGYCVHYVSVGCNRWKYGCEKCPQRKKYSQIFDRSAELYRRKRELLQGLDMTIITPSQWLADQLKQSFLKEYPVKTIANGIDLDVFMPSPSNFRERYAIPASKQILLGVAFAWSDRKGLDVFIELAHRLDPDQYQIVLVGISPKIEAGLPGHILSISRIYQQEELAEIYTAADLFINPTREEVLGMVNVEALACGTPVLTFRTGGGPECLDYTCGSVVDYNDIDAMEREIHRICREQPYAVKDCWKKSREFDMRFRFEEYMALYEYN